MSYVLYSYSVQCIGIQTFHIVTFTVQGFNNSG